MHTGSPLPFRLHRVVMDVRQLEQLVPARRAADCKYIINYTITRKNIAKCKASKQNSQWRWKNNINIDKVMEMEVDVLEEVGRC